MATARKTPVPVDMDLDALAHEATDEAPAPFTFRLHGQVFSLAVGNECDFRVLDELGKNNLAEAIRMLLGPEQYDQFTTKPVSMKILTKVLEGWSTHKGLPLGE